MASTDILLCNGRLIDGTGAPARDGHVLVSAGRIARVGAFDPAEHPEARRIDTGGRVIAPGFIDAHCHGEPLTEPEFENYLAMGVTTIALGQDGRSPSEGRLDNWFDQVDRIAPGVNVLTLAGHGTLRHASGIGYRENPSREDLARMSVLAGEAMDQGAFGLSTGLEYLPGLYADTDELIEIARPIGQRGGLVMSHMRTEDDPEIDDAIRELIAQGRGANCHVHVSHIKLTFGKDPARAGDVLALLEDVRRDGVRVSADIYPYCASCTTVAIVFPPFAKAPNDYGEAVRTRRDELAAYIRNKGESRNGPEAMLFVEGRFAGKSLKQVADEMGKSFEDVLIDDIGPDYGEAAYFVMDEAVQERLLLDPSIMISSDGSPTMGHPRGYGAFARIIEHFVGRRGVLTLEEAVRKMTGLSAQTFGLDRQGRGFLREGFAADLVVFDPSAVREKADYRHPHVLAAGFDLVLVNGRIVREEGGFTGGRAGRALRRIPVGAQRASKNI